MIAVNHIFTSAIRRILSVVLLLFLQSSLWAQYHDVSYYLTNGDTAEIQLCGNGFITLYRLQDSGPYDAWAIVDSPSLLSAYVTNSVSVLSTGEPIVTIRDGNNQLLDSAGHHSTPTYLQQCTQPLTVHFHIDSGDIVYGSTSVQINRVSEGDYCHSAIANIATYERGDSIVVAFQTNDDTILTKLDDGPWVPVETPNYYGNFAIHGLHSMARGSHTVTLTTVADSNNNCCWYTHTFHLGPIPPAQGCIKATDLHAEYTNCTYINYGKPDVVEYGVVDMGPYTTAGRHTVMRDTTLHDFILGPRLLTVCPGCDSTVRLGNSDIGAEWEAVDYHMTIDTTLNAIMILKYAAVLENPAHPPEKQPRFSFDLLDTNMLPVGNACAHADFVSSDDMGWNQMAAIMWKDWTTVGFDLSDYHGQSLILRFKTYDCTQGGHFGYAYFTTQCATRNITALYCGDVDYNIFSAPEGFNYLWTDTSGNVLSHGRTISLPSSNSVYHCYVSSIEDTNCTFTLSTYAGIRLPKAAGRVETMRTADCHTYEVGFCSESFVTSDGINPVPYDNRCNVMWHFGDGDSAAGNNPTHTYRTPGTYTVAIIASIGGGSCVDTALLTVVLPTLFDHEEQIYACDSLRWRDGVMYIGDTLGVTWLATDPGGCDTLYTLYTLNLHLDHAPKAALKLTPQQLTYEDLTLHAYDISDGDYRRHWTIVHDDGDSLALPDTAAHLVYTTDVGDDSTWVVLVVNDGVCTATATGCIYLVRADFFAPNVFTPGQADNNRFVITGTGTRQLSLSIYNRQGLLVFTTDRPEEGWDGTSEGRPCPQGAYVWHLTYAKEITPDRIHTAVGTVTLLR